MGSPRLTFVLVVAFMSNIGAIASASLVTSAPIPVTHRVTVQPVIVSNDNGANTATFMGSSSNEAIIKQDIDLIWSAAGIDVQWLTPNFWNDTFANFGNQSPSVARFTGDLDLIVNNGVAAGVAGPSTMLTMYFVEIAPGHAQLSNLSAAGLTQTGFTGSAMFIGDTLPGAGIPGDLQVGNELTAKTIAHEIGHNLGLNHFSSDTFNLMHETGTTPPVVGGTFATSQITAARGSRFAVAVPEPSSVLGWIAGGAMFWLVRRRRK